MAKGVEDTAFYCFNRLVGLNEVGGSPNSKGVTITKFHEYCRRMQEQHPLAMTTLSTHDTKRSDDVRARLAVLSEIPSRWRTALHRWTRMNRPFKTKGFPDHNTEWFLYQTLIGAWPISKDRAVAYMEKADQWVPRGHVLRCVVEGYSEGDDDQPFISIDEKDFTLTEFAKMVGTFGGWGMRITFVPDDELHEEPVVEVREPDPRR